MGQNAPPSPRVNASSEKERDCHRIKDGNERQREQLDRSFKVGCRYTEELGEISYRSDLSLGTPALRVNIRLFDLQIGECLGLTPAFSHDVGTFAAFLVSERHRSDRPANARRLLDGRVNLGDASVDVGNHSALYPEASLDICDPVGKGKVY